MVLAVVAAMMVALAPVAGAHPFCTPDGGSAFGAFHSGQASGDGLSHKPGGHTGFAVCQLGDGFLDGVNSGRQGPPGGAPGS